MKLFNIFKKHDEETAKVGENGMELFKGEIFEIEIPESKDMPGLEV